LTPKVAGVDARLHTDPTPQPRRPRSSRRLTPGVGAVLAATTAAIILAACGNGGNSNINLNPGSQPNTNPTATRVRTIPGMPAVVNPTNLYSQTRAGQFSPATQHALTRV
jgi:hypothetical protein